MQRPKRPRDHMRPVDYALMFAAFLLGLCLGESVTQFMSEILR